MTATHTDKRRSASVIVLVKIIAVFGLGIALLAASTLPFAAAKTRIDSLAADGVAENFTAEAYTGVVLKLRVAGIALLAAGALGLGLRRILANLLSCLIDSFGELWRRCRSAWGEALRADGALHIAAFCMTIVVAVILRLLFINQPIRYDEAHSFMYYASRPLYLGLSNYASVNNHLFHTLLVHISYSMFGNHEWALRLPALIAGILLVPATYLAARMLYNKRAAVLAASLAGSSSALVEFSTNARGYTLICLFFMVLLALGAHLKRSSGAAGWSLFTLVTALGFYTVPIMLYPFGIVCVWLFLSALAGDTDDPARTFIRYLVTSSLCAGALTFVLYSPVFVGSGFRSVFGIPSLAAKASGGWEGFADGIIIRVRGFWAQWNRDLPFALSALLVAGLVLSLVFHRRLAAHRVPLPAAALLWCAPVMIAMRALPWPRVWLYLLPLYFVLASAGLSLVVEGVMKLLRRRPDPLCAVVALIVSMGVGINVAHSRSVFYSEETGTLRSAEEVAMTLGPKLGPGDKLLAYSPAGAPLLYYFRKHGIPTGPLVSENRKSWKRVYVVVDTPVHTLNWVLGKTRLDRTSYTAPRIFRKYQFGEIYVCERR